MSVSFPQLRTVARLSLLVAFCTGLLGCESNSDTLSSDDGGSGAVDFIITPSAVQLGLGETLASFTVQGGDVPLAWTVSDAALGTLTDTEGRIANYNRVGATEGVNEIRVTDAIGRTASAVVLQDDNVDGGPLRVSPGSRSIREADGSVTFEARGGAPPYQWSVIDPALGTLSNTSQSFVNYRRKGNAAGANVIELTDSQGTLVTATVQQPAVATASDDTAQLRISPGRPAIREADGIVTLQAIGGVPPYSWTVSDASLGALSNTSQSFVNYRRNGTAAGTNVVELRDSRNVTTPAIIEQPPLP